MKLDQSMVGRKVKSAGMNTEWIVRGIYQDKVWLSNKTGYITSYNEHWELVECQCKDRTPGGAIYTTMDGKKCSECGEPVIPKAPKLPSERIAEIVGFTSSDPEWQEKTIGAIIKVMNEDFARAEGRKS